MSNYPPPRGYRQAQSVVLHDDSKHIQVSAPESDSGAAEHFGYHIHPFYEDFPACLNVGELFSDALNPVIFRMGSLEPYGGGGSHEVYGAREIHALYIRMELNGAISIIIIEQFRELDDAPLIKRELTYRGKYSIYWGADEVSR
jgi:hypothetical protein